jgi:uncharacterized membrane protein
VYAATLTAASLHRHDLFQSGYDVAIFDQGVWLLGHLHDPFSTVRGRNLFADHFQPALVLFTPFGLLGIAPSALFGAQAAALAGAGVVLGALARTRGAPVALAAAVGGLWLASPLVQWANLFEFHPETMVPLLLALGALFLERGRHALFVLSVGLACCFKEDVSLVAAAWGLVLVLRGQRRLGTGLLIGAPALFVIATKVVMPAFGGNLDYYSKRFAGDRGTSVGSVLAYVVDHPGAALDQLATRQNAVLIFALVACTGGLALFAPRVLVLAVPPVAANVLSAYAYQHDLHFHYQIVAAATVAIAGAYGAAAFAQRRPQLVRPAAWVLVLGAVGVTVAASPAIDVLRHEKPSPHAAAKRAALAVIPSGVAVAGEPDVIAHLAERRAVYQLPEPFVSRPTNGEAWSDAELRRRATAVRYVVYSTGALDPGLESQVKSLPPLLAKRGFHVVLSSDGVVVYARGG